MAVGEGVEAMTVSKLQHSGLGSPSASALVAALLFAPGMSRTAQAFGGFWSSAGAAVEQSGAQIIFVDNPDATLTAIVRVKYAGPGRSFAWLMPVPGTPTVAVSSNTVFERLDAATAPEYWVEVAVEGMCMPAGASQTAPDGGPSGSGGAPGMLNPTPSMVQPIDHGTIGPYDFSIIAMDPTLAEPGKAARDWLTTNGYDLTGLETELLGPYSKSGFNLLAIKLRKDADEGAIRPVMVTYDGKRPLLPIRPTATAARADMGIQVWVIGPAQAVPGNYRSLVLNEALIDWTSGRKYPAGTLPLGGAGPANTPRTPRPSNYDAVVSAAADEAGGQGFVTELGAPVSLYRNLVWSQLDDQTFAKLMSQDHADGIDAILMTSAAYSGWDGWSEAIAGATRLPSGVSLDEFGADPERYRGSAEVDPAEFLQLLATKVVSPVADTAALFSNAPYLTRLFSTMSADEMTLDPSFDFNPDLAPVSNIHLAKQSVACNAGLSEDAAPFRIELPHGGAILGQGGEGWPLALGSMPANLEVVQLSATGSGSVIADNRARIGKALLEITGTRGSGSALSQAPQNGLTIGGSQRVRFPDSKGGMQASRAGSVAGGACNVSRVGAGSGARTCFVRAAGWWQLPVGLLLGLLLGLRRRMQRRVALRACACACAGALLAGCGDTGGVRSADDAGPRLLTNALTPEQLRDPENCKGCHPIHYREWSSSMHAYAAKDPVFVAMNRRGQRETHGELGDFCIKCHAPMAVIDGRSRDGLDLDQLPDRERGVSCYFCHNVVGIEGNHNALLKLGNDDILRGPLRDPARPGAHRARFSELFEDTNPKSTELCGGCHDIVTPAGVHLERTFEEYRNGLFSKSATGAPPAFDSCVGCHMPGQKAVAAVVPAGLGVRTVHEHLWPGIDVPLTPFPHADALRSAIEDCELGPASVSFFTLEVTPPDLFSFQFETKAGHNQPSGAAQDRRMWFEFLAYDANGRLLEASSSGKIADGELEDRPPSDPKHDPHLLLFRDRIYDGDGKPVHMFWQAATSKAHPSGYESNVVPVATTSYIDGTHTVLKQYHASSAEGLPARVTARLRVRPIGVDVLEDLVESGDLDPTIATRIPTLSFGAQIEWTPADGVTKTVSASPMAECGRYRCLLDPSSQYCK